MKLTALTLLSLTLVHCTSTMTRQDAARVAAAPKQVIIQFKGKAGETTETHYYSNSRTRAYAETQMTTERQEIVDFNVATRTTAADAKTISATVETIRKDGTVDLHDLAFPELHEEIAFILRPNGEILKAGKYSPQSIYFVPSMPVPDHPVEVGDTWTLEHAWLSAKDHIPLKLAVVGILKAVVPCESRGYCADVEVSGSVALALAPDLNGSRFDSRVWGRVLFSLDRGDVIWSEMRSQEEMAAQNERTVVGSCMVSQMNLRGAAAAKLECDPTEQPVQTVPRL